MFWAVELSPCWKLTEAALALSSPRFRTLLQGSDTAGDCVGCDSSEQSLGAPQGMKPVPDTL